MHSEKKQIQTKVYSIESMTMTWKADIIRDIAIISLRQMKITALIKGHLVKPCPHNCEPNYD